MEETKVQIGEDVLLDIGIHSDWYISAVGYNGESVDVVLRRKADEECKWWLADTPQTDCPYTEDDKCFGCGDDTKCVVFDTPQTDLVEDDKCFDCEDFFDCDEHQTDCPWK